LSLPPRIAVIHRPVFNRFRTDPMNTEPLLYTVDEARRIIASGNTRLYELIGAGKLDARKAGGRTLITGESLRAYAASLPKADIRTGQRTAA
jgi:hypothetical protein